MLGALVLAACLAPPLYGDVVGPACPDETQECRCTECFVWERPEGATSYRIERATDPSGAWTLVGTTADQYWTDPKTGEVYFAPAATTWCVGRDSSIPRQGTLYRYVARSCNANGCTATGNIVHYRGAPYACFAGGVEVQCYVGDPLIDRTQCFRLGVPEPCPAWVTP